MEIIPNASLKKYNTFGVEAYAKTLIHIDQEDDLAHLYAMHVLNGKFLVLGGGSNMLFVRDYEGVIIHMAIKGLQHRQEGTSVMITAKGGELWNDVVQYCVENGFGGIENLTLIPGTVGAAPVQNIGAYGVELQDVFHSCRAFDIEKGEFRVFYKEDCAFSYRDSIFKQHYKGRYLITEVNLLLTTTSKINISYGAITAELLKRGIHEPTISDVSAVVAAIRVGKLPDPATIGNAGSFFKNPIVSVDTFNRLLSNFVDIVYYPYGEDQMKLAAGWLIEQCGWKGKIVGNTGTWQNQALVLVNHGSCTGLEVYELSQRIIDSVYNRFGVQLEREVNVIS